MKPYAVDFHVKIRGPNQGLGSIPASKNEALGLIPESIKCYSGSDPIVVLYHPNPIAKILRFWDLIPAPNKSCCGIDPRAT